MTILVTGCAGYIGSICSQLLLEADYAVVGIDNLSRGLRTNIPKGLEFYETCISDTSTITEILQKHQISAVLHFAAYIDVAESVREPNLYKNNNYLRTLAFIKTLREQGVSNFIFSSTAAVYGDPALGPSPQGGSLFETTSLNPINPYGYYKLEVEKYLAGLEDFNYIILRYFNVAGAYGDLGECHDPETHLIPLAIDAALGLRENFSIYGSDYPSPDGTAIRDYVHVVDLATAHIAALEALSDKTKSNQAYNLGYGRGFSVQEILNAIERVSARKIPRILAPRREGDPAILVASSDKARSAAIFQPKHDSIDKIIRDALDHRLKYR